MADLRIIPRLPNSRDVDDPTLKEALRRLELITSYVDAAPLNLDELDQFRRDVSKMARKGSFAAPKRK